MVFEYWSIYTLTCWLSSRIFQWWGITVFVWTCRCLYKCNILVKTHQGATQYNLATVSRMGVSMRMIRLLTDRAIYQNKALNGLMSVYYSKPKSKWSVSQRNREVNRDALANRRFIIPSALCGCHGCLFQFTAISLKLLKYGSYWHLFRIKNIFYMHRRRVPNLLP